MTIQRLSRLSDWKLKDKDQDLCGKVLRAQDGQEIGRVIDMVVDTEAGLVTSVVMQDDTHVATEDIDLLDGQIWLSPAARQPESSSRETSRFVPGERQVDAQALEMDEPEIEEIHAREPDGIRSAKVHVYRNSASVREQIRQALEEHKHTRRDDEPPRPRG